MRYRTLEGCIRDLRSHGHLVECDQPVDPDLEMAEIHRRVFRSGGPAILFTNVRNCRFPMVSNLFGTIERARFLFRSTWESVRRAIELKSRPQEVLRRPIRYWKTPLTGWRMRPRQVRRGPVERHTIRLGELPQLTSWPDDGGPFITLPQVFTEHPGQPGWSRSNLGMYRVQLAGNAYVPDREVGLHYQIHRGIGVHHRAAVDQQLPLRVSIFVGGTPAMTLAAVMPLPEGMSELTFAGALAGHRIPLLRDRQGYPLYAEADFCIVGTVVPGALKPEGPFGDHLGYYSLRHPYPVLQVENVYHRAGAIWPFTVVGRPPQEDSVFGRLIHELTGPIIPTVLPGVVSVHAVDAAGVHPLLLAVGSERYQPYRPTDRPQEILTQANAILGQGQMSLAKYLWILDRASAVDPDPYDVERFFQLVLERVDWQRDLHFQTRSTIDTLDYSGSGLNEGSKLVVAAAGPVRRPLPTALPEALDLPHGFRSPRIVLPGVLVVQGPAWSVDGEGGLARFCRAFRRDAPINRFPLVVLCDDADFCCHAIDHFLWVTFTRSNPAADIDGIESGIEQKHWGCRGSLVIDARVKPHHAPPLIEDAEVNRRVDALAARGGPLSPFL